MELMMKNKTYRFEAQSLVRGDIEATVFHNDLLKDL